MVSQRATFRPVLDALEDRLLCMHIDPKPKPSPGITSTAAWVQVQQPVAGDQGAGLVLYALSIEPKGSPKPTSLTTRETAAWVQAQQPVAGDQGAGLVMKIIHEPVVSPMRGTATTSNTTDT